MERELGMLTDHTGKRSASRGTSLLATVTLCVVALVQVLSPESKDASDTLLLILGGVAVGPIAANRYFGEDAIATLKAKS